MASWLVFTLLALSATCAVSLGPRRKVADPLPVVGDVGPRLILTDLIEGGNIVEAQDYARVSGGPFPENIPSYSGFLTVDKEYNSNLFFWFFPAEQNYENAPVIVWLEGGPGYTSLFTLFTENGPFRVSFDEVSLIENPYSWHKNHSLIFIDNPVGTGFSFTDQEEGYATNDTEIGNALYSALTQFFTLFPELQKNEFFVTGESYAGKYVPALAYTIHNANPTAELKINLQGIAVGNGFTDPYTFFEYADYNFQIGLIDVRVRDEMKALEVSARSSIDAGDFVAAYYTWHQIVDMWRSTTGYDNIYNYLYPIEPAVGGSFANFVQGAEVRQLIHVGDAVFNESSQVVNDHLIGIFMTSLKPWLEILLDNYRVLYYSGQVDVMLTYPVSVAMYQTLQWSHTQEYLSATRQMWYVQGELAGYMKSAGNFTEVLVRNAGHEVPTDQPVWALDMITKFTFNNMP